MNGEMQNNQGMSAAQYLSQISVGVPNPNMPVNQPLAPKQSGNWKWVWILAGVLLILVVVLVIMLIPFDGESAVDKMVQSAEQEGDAEEMSDEVKEINERIKRYDAHRWVEEGILSI